MHDTDIYLDQLRHLMMEGHLRGALELLNIQSGYRFTAIYRLGPTHAENFMLVDRDNAPDNPFTADIPRDETYCHMVQSLAAAALVIEDAAVDPRLSAHPYRDHVRAYCSVPLQEEDTTIYGTLCQFDTAPMEVSPATLVLMQEMGRMLRAEDVSSSHRRAGIDQRVGRLAAMKDAILDASLDRESARSAFDGYARPLIEEARQRLPTRDVLEVEARVDAILQALLQDRVAGVGVPLHSLRL